jgi:Protein of unknown function (DUF3501)
VVSLTVSDVIVDHESYAAARPAARTRMIPLRAERRLRVGDMLLFEFENVDTLRYQVQEMVYTERLTNPAEIAHEIEVYSRLLPTSHSLAATMFIELDVPDTVRAELDRLEGIQRHVLLDVGGEAVPAAEIPGPDEDPGVPSETVSVHMLRFPFTDAQRDAFRDPAVPVELIVAHPAYDDATPITGGTRRRLIADLALPA